MKKQNVIGLVVLAVAVAALFLAPSVPVAQGVVQGLVSLPDEAKDLVLTLVTAGVAWLLLKVNLGDYTQPLAAAIAPILIAAIERLTGLIPPIYDNVLLAAIHLLVLFVGSIGTVMFFRRFKTPAQLLQ